MRSVFPEPIWSPSLGAGAGSGRRSLASGIDPDANPDFGSGSCRNHPRNLPQTSFRWLGDDFSPNILAPNPFSDQVWHDPGICVAECLQFLAAGEVLEPEFVPLPPRFGFGSSFTKMSGDSINQFSGHAISCPTHAGFNEPWGFPGILGFAGAGWPAHSIATRGSGRPFVP
jgi:hypothetical protein